jgi:hypothetical protein
MCVTFTSYFCMYDSTGVKVYRREMVGLVYRDEMVSGMNGLQG